MDIFPRSFVGLGSLSLWGQSLGSQTQLAQPRAEEGTGLQCCWGHQVLAQGSLRTPQGHPKDTPRTSSQTPQQGVWAITSQHKKGLVPLTCAPTMARAPQCHPCPVTLWHCDTVTLNTNTSSPWARGSWGQPRAHPWHGSSRLVGTENNFPCSKSRLCRDWEYF